MTVKIHQISCFGIILFRVYPCPAQFYSGNLKTHFHSHSFVDIEILQVVEILP